MWRRATNMDNMTANNNIIPHNISFISVLDYFK